MMFGSSLLDDFFREEPELAMAGDLRRVVSFLPAAIALRGLAEQSIRHEAVLAWKSTIAL